MSTPSIEAPYQLVKVQKQLQTASGSLPVGAIIWYTHLALDILFLVGAIKPIIVELASVANFDEATEALALADIHTANQFFEVVDTASLATQLEVSEPVLLGWRDQLEETLFNNPPIKKCNC